MISECPVCGKEFDILYPHLWKYARGTKFLCSWGCLRKFDERVAEKILMRTKKDGTPAKKPGPKKKIETQEGITIHAKDVGADICVEIPEVKPAAAVKPEKPRRKQLEVALLSDVLESWDLQYRKFGGKMVAFAEGVDQPLELSLEEWIRMSHEILDALDQLGVEE